MKNELPETTEQVELAPGITIGQYKAWEANMNKAMIANFINNRFICRYIEPVRSPSVQSGFTKMAVACLLIEALESFCQGRKDTSGWSELAFCNFFDRTQAFPELRGFGHDFYIHIRCGILHQAETTGGWIIRRGPGEGNKTDPAQRIINADDFLQRLEGVLERYREKLIESEWNSTLWINLRQKVNYVISNCNRDFQDRP